MEIKLVIKNLPTTESQEPDGFRGEFCKIFEELMPVLFKLFQKIKRGGNTPKFILGNQHCPDTKVS